MSNRIVVFSDVQGNSVALQAMFDYLQKLPDFDSLEFICLGDVASGYDPNMVVDTLRENNINCIKGNMDDVILYPEAYTGNDEEKRLFNEIDFWCHNRLSLINQDFLINLRFNMLIECFGLEYCFAHGNYYDYITSLKPDTPLTSLVVAIPQSSHVAFTGNTHRQFLIPVQDKLLICPGSIGFPDALLENGKRPLRAQFVIVDEGRFEFATINYSIADFTFSVMNSGMPHAIRYLSLWDI